MLAAKYALETAIENVETEIDSKALYSKQPAYVINKSMVNMTNIV
jgi:hypothetical protein